MEPIPSDPAASPLRADLAGLPPIRVHVGDDEVLLDDSVRLSTGLWRPEWMRS